MILSAGIIVVRSAGARWLYLFLRAYRSWDFPKGVVEQGETPLTAALRETREETGLSGLRFSWGSVFIETAPYLGGRKKARYYLAETAEVALTLPISPEIGRAEHHEYRWLSGNALLLLAPQRLQPVILWARQIIEKQPADPP